MSASPLRVSLVPSYIPCAAPNSQHGPPLAYPSCNPPLQTSGYITVGTPDANGAAPNSVGFVEFRVVVGTPEPPDDSDVKVEGTVTDVRCMAGTTACGSANSLGGADYTGELQVNWTSRATDHFNATSPGGGTDPATLVDLPGIYGAAANVSCAATLDPTIGSTCSFSTTGNAMQPGSIKDGKRQLLEFGSIYVIDGGADGFVSTSPNTTFASQGVFVP